MNIPDDLNPIIRKIDEQLKAQGIPPHAREIRAIAEFARLFNISLPLSSVSPHAPEEIQRNAVYSERIKQWFDEMYGEHLKVDHSANAKVAVLADGDIWKMRIPLIIGSAVIVPSRSITNDTHKASSKPVTLNPCSYLDHITSARLSTFSDADIKEVCGLFLAGLNVRNTFAHFRTAHQKFVEAESDWAVAVLHLTSQVPNYGQSRWASLQMAEKFMKGLLEIIGDVKVKHVHNLTELHTALATSIPGLNLGHLLNDLQCSAKVRYGETPSTRTEAYAAHKASLLLVQALGSIKNGNES